MSQFLIQKITSMGNQSTGQKITQDELDDLVSALRLSNKIHVIWYVELATKELRKIIITKEKKNE